MGPHTAAVLRPPRAVLHEDEGAAHAAQRALPRSSRKLRTAFVATPWLLAIAGFAYGALVSGLGPAQKCPVPAAGRGAESLSGATVAHVLEGAAGGAADARRSVAAEQRLRAQARAVSEPALGQGVNDGTGSATVGSGLPGGGAAPPLGEEAIERLPSAVRALACKRCLRFGAGMADRRCLPAACDEYPATGRKVVSMSLYGADQRYVGGSIRNAEIAGVVFPGWELRFYVKDDVHADVLAEMRALGTRIEVVTDADVGFGMNWRFLVADDPAVAAFVCRDADSRWVHPRRARQVAASCARGRAVHGTHPGQFRVFTRSPPPMRAPSLPINSLSLRDHYAVEDWVMDGTPFHVVRDHLWHTSMKVMGGTWGARRPVFEKIGAAGAWPFPPRPTCTRAHGAPHTRAQGARSHTVTPPPPPQARSEISLRPSSRARDGTPATWRTSSFWTRRCGSTSCLWA